MWRRTPATTWRRATSRTSTTTCKTGGCSTAPAWADARFAHGSSRIVRSGGLPLSVTPGNARVLFVTADQQRRDSLPVYGLDFVQAPNLERVAREGAAFDRAYTPAPLCQPARAAILTGLQPHVHGVLDNHVWFTPPVRSWVPDVTAA